MRQTLLIAVLVFTASASIALGQKQSGRRDSKRSVDLAIRQVDHERIQAQIEADAEGLDRIYADDFIGIGPSGTVRTKAQVISDFTSGDLKFQSITTDDVQVRVYENTAVETGLSTMVGQDKGKAVARDTRFTRVWVKQQGRWRLVANHYSSQTTPISSHTKCLTNRLSKPLAVAIRLFYFMKRSLEIPTFVAATAAELSLVRRYTIACL